MKRRQKRAYRYRFYPTDEQQHLLARTFGCVRFVYNWALRLRTDAYDQQQKYVSYCQSSALLTALKQRQEYRWLLDVSCVPLQQALRHLDRAFKNFYEGRADYPVFKKKHREQSAEYTASAFTCDGTRLTLAKMDAPLAIQWSRPIPKGCKPTTVTVTRDRANRYFVSILVEQDIMPLPRADKMVGLDLGLTSMVVLSTGESVGNPKFFHREEQKLAKAQRRLAKSISDVGWGEFVRQLKYKASWYGRTLVTIDRWYPATKRCSHCGHVLDSLSLDERFWTCPACGRFHDRDHNAAQNVLAVGHTPIRSLFLENALDLDTLDRVC